MAGTAAAAAVVVAVAAVDLVVVVAVVGFVELVGRTDLIEVGIAGGPGPPMCCLDSEAWCCY